MLYDFTPLHKVVFVRTRAYDGLVELVRNREEVEVGDQIFLGANRFEAQRYEMIETRSRFHWIWGTLPASGHLSPAPPPPSE